MKTNTGLSIGQLSVMLTISECKYCVLTYYLLVLAASVVSDVPIGRNVLFQVARLKA